MTKLEELYIRKGEAHTQVEIWQQVLRDVNQALSQELQRNPGGLNGIKKDPGDSKKLEQGSNRKSG